jgi:isopentenyl diphosphate isomerase/L-lactate dehydrogenase-like FMN-dependent dehydrogenase
MSTTTTGSSLPRRRQFHSVAEAERLARRRLPHAMYDRLASGSDTGATLRANLRAFEEVSFRPRGAAVVPDRSATTSVLGARVTAPVLLAPIGALRLQHPEGAAAAIEAAGAFGTVCGISPVSGHRWDELRPVEGASLWAQVTTALGGRGQVEEQIAQVKDLGYQALVVTVDSGVRPKSTPIKLDARTALAFAPDLLRHPRWTAGFLRDGMRVSVANTALQRPTANGARPLVWDDVTWIREAWSGPVVVKGVVTAEDTRRATDLGADAIVVSNHGGLALDGAPGTLSVLREVVAAAGPDVEVLLDGGVRTGGDVAKALALGARAVMIGRPYVMGLAVGGALGARRVLEILHEDLLRAMGFLGCSRITDLNPDHVRVPPGW